MKILFAAYGGGHIRALLPVIRELAQENSSFEPEILAFTIAADYCRAQGFACKTMRDFAHLFPPEAIEMGRKLALELPNHVVDIEESAAYLGIAFHELCAQIGKNAATQAYREKGRASFLPVRAMERILAEVNSGMVVATNSPRSEQALLLAARNLGIPSLCVVDFYLAAIALPQLAQPGYGTRICVLDEFVKNQLVKAGRDPAEIVITGNPAFDHYGKKEVRENAQKYRRENIGESSRLISYASNVEPESGNEIPLQHTVLDFLAKECARLGYRLSHRQHPSEAIVTRPADVLNGNAVPLETFISSSDLLVTFPSTVIYEARLLGVPSIALGMSKLTGQAHYLAAGKYALANDFAELRSALENLADEPEHAVIPQGKASKSVIDTIKKIACK